MLDPEPEPEPEPHPQGLFCDCRPGLPLGPQRCCTGLDTTGCYPAHGLLTSPECSLGVPGRLKELIAVVRTGPQRQQPSSNRKHCVGCGPPARWPALVVASSGTAAGLGLRCLGPGLWAFALYRGGEARRNAVRPAGVKEMPPSSGAGTWSKTQGEQEVPPAREP